MPYKKIEDKRKRDRERYAKNPKRKLQCVWVKTHKKEKKIYDKSYRLKHRKKMKENRRKWKKDNPDHWCALKMIGRWKVKYHPEIINLLKLYFLVRKIVKKGDKNVQKNLKIYKRNCRNFSKSCQ